MSREERIPSQTNSVGGPGLTLAVPDAEARLEAARGEHL